MNQARHAVAERRATCAGGMESRGADEEANAEKVIPGEEEKRLFDMVGGTRKIGAISF